MPYQPGAAAAHCKIKNGDYVGVFGPNYIWSGKYDGEDEQYLYLKEVRQIFETGPHAGGQGQSEYASDYQAFPLTAICNWGKFKWAETMAQDKGL